jgi:hypothetical protein
MFFAPLKGAYGSTLTPTSAAIQLNGWAAWLVAQAAEAAGSDKARPLGGAGDAGGERGARAQ